MQAPRRLVARSLLDSGWYSGRAIRRRREADGSPSPQPSPIKGEGLETFYFAIDRIQFTSFLASGSLITTAFGGIASPLTFPFQWLS